MAQADTLQYWNAMVPLRQSSPVFGAAPMTVRVCDAKIEGDDAYYNRCPQAWVDLQAPAATRQALDLAFPAGWFSYCQRYLTAALGYKPSSSSSSEFKVLWALDVWTHVHYGLFALNVNWSAKSPLYGDSALHQGSYLPQGQALAALGLLLDGDAKVVSFELESARTAEISASERRGGNETILAAQKAAKLSVFPMPFVHTLIHWCNFSYTRGPKHSNKLWPRLVQALQPWRSDFSTLFQRHLPSKGGKDSADLAMYAADPPLLYAAMQWRLFSVLDLNDQWPVNYKQGARVRGPGLGVMDSTVPLSRFLAAQVGSRTGSVVYVAAGTSSAWFATLDYQLGRLVGLAGQIINADYRVLLSRYLKAYVEAHVPPVNALGVGLTNRQLVAARGKNAIAITPDDRLARGPLTYVDWRKIWNGYLAELTRDAQEAMRNPSRVCDRLSGAARTSCSAGYAKAASGARSKLPLASMFDGIGSYLVGVLGAAVGVYDDPYYVLESPFARALTVLELRFATDCSTVEFGARLGVAMATAESLHPGIFSSTNPPQLLTRDCKTYFYGPNETPCEVCVGELPKPCTDQLPPSYTGIRARNVDIVMVGPTRLVATPAVPPAVQQQLVGALGQWVKENPQYKNCIGLDGISNWMTIGAAVYKQQITFEQGMGFWAAFVTSRCGVRSARKRTTWFGQVVTRAIVPINPLRGFGGSR
jgi:hypothetical protein